MLRFHFLAIIIFGSLFLTYCTEKAREASKSENSTIAFTNVYVIPMDQEVVLEDQTVIIREGIISEIGSSIKINIPSEAEVMVVEVI